MDIYSLGIMFYEMCFPFSTNMERIQVIQNLRQRDILMNNELNEQDSKYVNKLIVFLIFCLKFY